jgi:hypothetical protein
VESEGESAVRRLADWEPQAVQKAIIETNRLHLQASHREIFESVRNAFYHGSDRGAAWFSDR